MKRISWTPLLLALVGLNTPCAVAANQDELWRQCAGVPDNGISYSLAISGCTALIQHGQLNTDDSASAFNSRGIAYGNLGQYARAIQDYDQAIRLMPNASQPFNNRGVAYVHLGQYARAIQDYDEAIRLKPDYADALQNRGHAYYYLDQYARAIQDYDEAIRFKPDYAYALHHRGLAYHLLGQDARAIQDYDRAIALEPNDADAFNNRGNAYAGLRQYARAIQDLNQALALKPDYAPALNNRCIVRAEWGQQLDVALADCTKAIQLEARAGRYNNRAFVYYRMGNYQAAIADDDAALALDSKLVDSLYVRGLAKLKRGDAAGGDADIARAKALDPKIADTYAGYGVRP